MVQPFKHPCRSTKPIPADSTGILFQPNEIETQIGAVAVMQKPCNVPEAVKGRYEALLQELNNPEFESISETFKADIVDEGFEAAVVEKWAKGLEEIKVRPVRIILIETVIPEHVIVWHGNTGIGWQYQTMSRWFYFPLEKFKEMTERGEDGLSLEIKKDAFQLELNPFFIELL